MLEELFANKYYKNLFTVKAYSDKNLVKINAIKANKQLETVLKGRPKKGTELGDGAMLIEVANENLSELARTIKTVDNTDV